METSGLGLKLHFATDIRTYAVIPLHESCGLIEWVPDTAGIRNLIAQVYEPRGIPLWVGHIPQRHAPSHSCVLTTSHLHNRVTALKSFMIPSKQSRIKI
jgi:phosphatidylinositol kinase/protein kinase (PI-3  family)